MKVKELKNFPEKKRIYTNIKYQESDKSFNETLVFIGELDIPERLSKKEIEEMIWGSDLVKTKRGAGFVDVASLASDLLGRVRGDDITREIIFNFITEHRIAHKQKPTADDINLAIYIVTALTKSKE